GAGGAARVRTGPAFCLCPPTPRARRCPPDPPRAPGCPSAGGRGRSLLAPHPLVEPHQLVVGIVARGIGIEPRRERLVTEDPPIERVVEKSLHFGQEVLGLESLLALGKL